LLARRAGLAGIALAVAAGVALADRAGPLASAPLAWGAAALIAALALRRRRTACAALSGLLVGGALAAAERADLDAARAQLAPWLDDRREETLSGTVAAPLEDDGRALRFALDLGGELEGVRVLVGVFRDPDDEAWTPPLLPGDRIEVTGLLRRPRGYLVPGAPPADRFASARGAVASMTTDWTQVDVVAAGEMDAWRAAALTQRRMARRITAAAGDADRDGVLRALVTGDTSAMSERVTAAYRDSGASHVLAVSGLHLAAVALFGFAALRRLWASLPALALRVDPTRAAALGAAPLAIAYTMVTGAAPSAVRSLWMVLILLLGAALDRRARLRDALGAAALIMLAARPASLYDPSLQLSFAATAALAIFAAARRRDATETARGWRGLPGRGWRAMRELVVASLWTWAATAPICALHFGAVALAGPVANLIAVPAVELAALPLGLAGAALAELWPDGGAAVLGLAARLTERVTGALGHVAGWIPPLTAPPPDALELAACALLLCAVAARAAAPGDLSLLSAMRRRRALGLAAAGAALLLVGSHVWRADVAPALRSELRVAFIDVGQGDAAVIELPGGGVWLVDGGGLPYTLPARDPDAVRRLSESPGREAVARYLAARRIRRIDLAILSHAHPDHYRGLGAIARHAAIDELWLARPHAGAAPGGEMTRLLADLTALGTRVRHPPAGAVLRHAGATLSLLAPGPSPDGGSEAAADPVRSENDNSLVLRLDFAGRRLLFTGDIEEEGEQDLIAARATSALAADLVKVPHHGSRTSSTLALVTATSPTWAVISCGHLNRFGFPHPEVAARWRAAGAEVMRTDERGTITAIVEADGSMRLETVAD